MDSENLLRNPAFRFHVRNGAAQPDAKTSHNVACWNTDAWRDVTVVQAQEVRAFKPEGE
jgi:hypothetical protein